MKTHLTETYLKAARIHLVILHCSLGKPLRICFPILRVYHSLIMIVRNVFISINKRMSKHSHILFSILHQSLHFTCIKLPSSTAHNINSRQQQQGKQQLTFFEPKDLKLWNYSLHLDQSSTKLQTYFEI